MKAIRALIFSTLILLSSYPISSADANTQGKFVIHYDGQLIQFTDQQPTIIDSRTLVPIRIVEDMGFGVLWNGAERSVLVTNNVKALKFVIEEPYVYNSERIYIMDVNAAIIGNRTMIPLRFLVEGFDLSVQYRNVNGDHHIDISNHQSYTYGPGIILGPSGDVDGVFNDQIFRSLEIDPTNHEIVTVGTEANGLFKSIDGGKSWKWFREGLLIDSNQNGNYPEFYDVSIGSDQDTYYAGFASSTGPATGPYPSAYAGVYVSYNGGQEWERRVNGLSSGSVGSIAVNPLDPSIAYAGVTGGMPSFSGWDFIPEYYPGGVFKTVDYGMNWSKVTDIPRSETSDYFRIKTYDVNTVFALGSKFHNHDESVGLMKSMDSGESWTVINPSGIYFGDFDNYDSKTIYGLSDNQGQPNGIYKTTDGGETWTKTPQQGYGALRVSPHNPDIVAYSSRDKLFISHNGLLTSKQVLTYDQSVPKAIITDIVFSPSNENIIYAGGPGLIIYKSEDQGLTFNRIVNLRDIIEDYRNLPSGLLNSFEDAK